MFSVWSPVVVLCGMQRNTHSRRSCEEGVCVCVLSLWGMQRWREEPSWSKQNLCDKGDQSSGRLHQPSQHAAHWSTWYHPGLTSCLCVCESDCVSVSVCLYIWHKWYLCQLVQLNYSVCFGLACAELLPHPSICVNLKLPLSLALSLFR